MPVGQQQSPLEAVARRFRWMTRIESPDAPGLAFYGAEVHPADFGLSGYGRTASLSGKGLADAQAFAGCAGEGVEHLSRLEWGTEQLVRSTAKQAAHGLDDATLQEILRLAGCDAAPAAELDWMTATRLSDGAVVQVPAILCLRRAGGIASIPSAISTGCAAGPSLPVATLAGLLEAVERDAVALWWTGGRRGTAIGLDTLARTGAVEALRQLRRDSETRTTWLLDLTADTDIPCVAALSVAAADGRGFACGTAARLDVGEAIAAALLELCQSELGHRLVAAKRRARGDAALNETDRRKLDRAAHLDAAACELLHPFGVPGQRAAADAQDAACAVRFVVERLQHLSVEPLLVDLTRPVLGVPVVRIIAPGLQPFPSSLVTDRLMRLAAQSDARTARPVGMTLF